MKFCGSETCSVAAYSVAIIFGGYHRVVGLLGQIHYKHTERLVISTILTLIVKTLPYVAFVISQRVNNVI